MWQEDGTPLIAGYDQFLQSLIVWAETTTIKGIKYLPPELGRTFLKQDHPNIHQKKLMAMAFEHRNYKYLMNRKTISYDRFSEWIRQESQQDKYTRLINSLDEPTLIMVEDLNENRKEWMAQYRGKHPLHMILPSYLISEDWTDQNGLNLADHEELIMEKILNTYENQKDTDFISKTVAEYLKANTSVFPILQKNTLFTVDSPNPALDKVLYQEGMPTAWQFLLNNWEKSTENITMDEYDEVNEMISLEDLLKEMSIVLERFDLRETVLALKDFQIVSIYQSDDIDMDSMREGWADELRDNLDSDDRDRFDEDSSDFEDDYPLQDYVDQFSWYEPELARSYENKVTWIWHKDRIINGNTDVLSRAPSPFSKMYSPPQHQASTASAASMAKSDNHITYGLEKNNLTTMMWGAYATLNHFPVANVIHNEAHPQRAHFIPIEIPLGPSRIREKIEEDQQPHQKSEVRANAQGLDLDIMFYYKPSDPADQHGRFYEPILRSTDEDRYGSADQKTAAYNQEQPKIAGWEDDIGIYSMKLKLQLHFEALAGPPINFVLGMPQKLLNLSTNQAQ